MFVTKYLSFIQLALKALLCNEELCNASELSPFLFPPELKETFALFDQDGDGCVTTAEIATIMRAMGMRISDGEMDLMLSRLDTDGN